MNKRENHLNINRFLFQVSIMNVVYSDMYCGVDDLTCRRIFRQVVAATAYIHSKGLLHRDIKVFCHLYVLFRLIC